MGRGNWKGSGSRILGAPPLWWRFVERRCGRRLSSPYWRAGTDRDGIARAGAAAVVAAAEAGVALFWPGCDPILMFGQCVRGWGQPE